MPVKPRILHVFPSFEIGGAQRRLVSLINRRKGHFTHSVFAMNGCYDALALVRDIDSTGNDLPQFPDQSGLAAIATSRRLLAEYQPDLLVTYNWGSVEWTLASRFYSGCATVHIQDGFGPDEQQKQMLRRKFTRAFAYRGCDAVVVPSHTLETIARKSWYIPQKRLHYIPNGIDIDRFICPPDASLLNELGLERHHRIIGTIAALRPEKNIGRLIEAFAQVNELYENARLVIVGDGIGMRPLKMLVERIGLYGKVIFTGALEKPERILPAFEIFALSSDTEQMPLSVIEAMATGLPVVSTNVGDVAAMVTDQNAAYIDGLEAPALVRNLSALMENPEAAKRMGAANQAKARRSFSLESMVEAYDKLFLSLTNKAAKQV